jgi:predicted enzyme related to lactoylglutathione lyase
MSPLPEPSVVLFAKDMARLAQFYEQVTALHVVAQAPDHVMLAVPGFQLVVHAIPAAIARGITISSPPKVREDLPLKLALPVQDIMAARLAAAALGGALLPAQREWQARGFVACDGHDPEGNVFQVRMAATNTTTTAPT